MEALPSLVSDHGPTGIAALAVLMVLTGMLVPRRTLTATEQQRDQWQAAYLAEVAGHNVTRDQLSDALVQGRVTNQILSNARAPKPRAGGGT